MQLKSWVTSIVAIKRVYVIPNAANIKRVLENKIIGRTSYMQGIVPDSYWELFWQTPIRLVYFMFALFIWTIEIASDIIGFFDTVLYMILLYYGISGGLRLYKKQRQAIVVFVMLIIINLAVMFSWGTTNYGTAWRHRQKLAPFIVILASVGVAASPRWKLCLKDNYDDDDPQLELLDI